MYSMQHTPQNVMLSIHRVGGCILIYLEEETSQPVEKGLENGGHGEV